LNQHKANLKPQFKVQIPLPIWQIRFDEKTGWLGIEARAADILQNAFYVIDSRSGDFMLSDYKPKAGWWSGLEDIYNGSLYLHLGNNQQFGRHEGILALNAGTGEMRWERPAYSFYGLTAHYLLAKELNQENPNLIGLDYLTGSIVSDALTSTQAHTDLSAFQAQRVLLAKVPGHYPADNMFFPELQLFLQKKIGTVAMLAIDYLETNRYFIMGYYHTLPYLKYTYQVAVFSLAGELLLQEELISNTDAISLDNFFILNDTLILAQNKDLLLGYAL